MGDTTVIHFIGLILLSTRLATDHHLIAEMPRIEHTHAMVRTMGTQLPADTSPGIMQHTAVIVFKHGTATYGRGRAAWTTQKLNDEYDYVVLDGVQLRIYPTRMEQEGRHGSLSWSSSMADVAWEPYMPHLKADRLAEAYTEKGHFSGAVAVIDLPLGHMSACKNGSRIDALLTVPTAGSITIEEVKPMSRRLILPPGAHFYIAHVPTVDLGVRTSETAKLTPHMTAYTLMAASRNSAIVDPQPGLEQCDGPRILNASTPGWSCPYCRGTDYQCSNVVWSP